MASTGSLRKKPKLERVSDDDVFSRFVQNKQLVEETREYMALLCYHSKLVSPVLTPLQISNCNAADDNCGYSFEKAYCSVRRVQDFYLFGSIFKRGIAILGNFLIDNTIPEIEQEKMVLGRLLNYLIDKDAHSSLLDLEMYDETEFSVILANHLFGKLTISQTYTLDQHGSHMPNKCPCEDSTCILTGDFGDTSIGNGEVWHGNLDMILDDDVAVCCKSKLDIKTDKSSADAKLKNIKLSDNHHIIAETIVCSFLHKFRHPESDNFLFPYIAAGSKGLVFVLYDAENDILLQSSNVPVLDCRLGEEIRKLNLMAVLLSWLVVNYRYLGSGLNDALKSTQKAKFFEKADSKLDIYRHGLKVGNVVSKVKSENFVQSCSLTMDAFMEKWHCKLKN